MEKEVEVAVAETEIDFKLPEVPDNVPKGIPRVHDFSNSACIGCEG